MKTQFILFGFFLFLSVNVFSQKIYITDNKTESDKVVFYTERSTEIKCEG